jgi:hypothetical protein
VLVVLNPPRASTGTSVRFPSLRRMAKHTGMGEALATDIVMLAKFVDRWRDAGSDRPLGLNELAWGWGPSPMSEGKVAVTMKYAIKQGWVERTSSKGDQAAWRPTAKLLEQFPADEPQVMPAEVEVELPSGNRVRSVPAVEAEGWRSEGDALPPAPSPRQLGR